jgi:hypothetical protein
MPNIQKHVRKPNTTPNANARRCPLRLEHLEDRTTPDVYTVTNTDSAATPGSLYQAVLDANARPGADEIHFAIPGGGVHTIHIDTPHLLHVTDEVVIDGYTQSGASPDTLAQGMNAVLLIELDGSTADYASFGFRIDADNCAIRGLAINGFGPNNGGVVSGSIGIAIYGSGNRVEGNFIGTDPTGTSARPNGSGVGIRLGLGNVIGGTTPAARNLISGNRAHDILLDGDSLNIVDGTRIQGNLIGTAESGTEALGGLIGIRVGGATGTVIGGTDPAARNVVSGHDHTGIEVAIDVTGTTIQGNYVGTDVTGTKALGNEHGVFLASTGTLVGGTASGAGNVISGNRVFGVYIDIPTTGEHVIQGNLIGTDRTGTKPIGNGVHGIAIFGDGLVTVGGTASGAGNTIAYSGQSGVFVTLKSEPVSNAGTQIRANRIFGSGGEGIELAAGANGGASAPRLTSARYVNGVLTIRGMVQGAPNAALSLDFFANDGRNALDLAEGERFLGSAGVTTDATGRATFTVQFATANPGSLITATASGSPAGTSEFSRPVPAAVPGPAPAPRFPVPGLTGGVSVAVGDLDGDGRGEIIVGAGVGNGPSVVVLSGATGAVLASFLAYGPGFLGGVFVAAGDLDGDGRSEIVTGSGAGSHVEAFRYSGGQVQEVASFIAYEGFAGGVRVAAGDLDGDGRGEIVTGAGPGAGPHVKAFRYSGGGVAVLASFFAYDPGFVGGAQVAVGDLDGDGNGEIITGAGPHVKAFRYSDGGVTTEAASFFAYAPDLPGAMSMAAADLDGDGDDELITEALSPLGPHVRAFVYLGDRLADFASVILPAPEPADPGEGGASELPPLGLGAGFAAGDLNADGRIEFVIGALGEPLLGVFDLPASAG